MKEVPIIRSSFMRLRVLRQLSGSVDGIDLTQFEPGLVYHFSIDIATFLMALGAAAPAEDDAEVATAARGQRLFPMRRQASLTRVVWTGPDRRRTKR